MAKMTKKIRRAISSDESIARYFHALERQMQERLHKRAQLIQVNRLRDDNVIEAMPIAAVHEGEQGLVVFVR